ncbi:MAG: AAA family ATPase [Eubacterium sp.]|nr:AAA family ATPase [Eubacterium sp.]
MATGIIICGLNGAGKSTFGKALAEKLGCYFIDSEDLYFPKQSDGYNFSSQRTDREAKEILFNKIEKHKDFVFASVKGNYGEDFYSFINYVVLLNVPKDIRLRRVKDRSYQKFGNRILPNGNLYEQEKVFFEFVKSRDENTVEEWIKTLDCSVIKLDGTKDIEKNVNLIIDMVK